ncbi:hypothetical protein F2P81_008870 [Scophthalmus maximus]|uniref:Uncharacterized protein n=1 Tax=Scophthalmus maximus TaxID=52904 RepID=A0A6A4ST43_SCOMX|nr:hypothetical protein F2P81_008870 [Scophthalmus maximus]
MNDANLSLLIRPICHMHTQKHVHVDSLPSCTRRARRTADRSLRRLRSRWGGRTVDKTFGRCRLSPYFAFRRKLERNIVVTGSSRMRQPPRQVGSAASDSILYWRRDLFTFEERKEQLQVLTPKRLERPQSEVTLLSWRGTWDMPSLGQHIPESGAEEYVERARQLIDENDEENEEEEEEKQRGDNELISLPDNELLRIQRRGAPANRTRSPGYGSSEIHDSSLLRNLMLAHSTPEPTARTDHTPHLRRRRTSRKEALCASARSRVAVIQPRTVRLRHA